MTESSLNPRMNSTVNDVCTGAPVRCGGPCRPIARALAAALLAGGALLLTACGGGSSTDSASTTTTTPASTATVVVTPTTQQLLEAAVLDSSGGIYSVTSSLPAKGTPTAPTHFAYSQKLSLTTTLSTAPQPVDALVDSVSAALPLPDFSPLVPTRAMVNGVLRTAANLPGKTTQRVYLVGGKVVRDTLDQSSQTIAFANQISTVQNDTMTGLVTAAPAEVKAMPILADSVANANLTKTKLSFVAGSGYTKLQELRFGDTYFVEDCTVATTVARPPSTCDGNGTLEGTFPHQYGTTLYALSNGTVQTIQGLRAWVSTSLVPASISVTDSYLVFFELGGKVYRGLLQKDGVAVKSRTSAGAVVDYSLYLNKKAIESVKAAF